jgi:hypothetical protein
MGIQWEQNRVICKYEKVGEPRVHIKHGRSKKHGT